jgi:hypothetical protein
MKAVMESSAGLGGVMEDVVLNRPVKAGLLT